MTNKFLNRLFGHDSKETLQQAILIENELNSMHLFDEIPDLHNCYKAVTKSELMSDFMSNYNFNIVDETTAIFINNHINEIPEFLVSDLLNQHCYEVIFKSQGYYLYYKCNYSYNDNKFCFVKTCLGSEKPPDLNLSLINNSK